jgi:hypothetical protein
MSQSLVFIIKTRCVLCEVRCETEEIIVKSSLENDRLQTLIIDIEERVVVNLIFYDIALMIDFKFVIRYQEI